MAATLLGGALFVSGCATQYQPVPEGYSGPTATIRDSGFAEDSTKAQMFAVVEIDGERVMNAFWASAQRSHGQGPMLSTEYPERKVKAVPQRLTLSGSHATGAPIHAMASQLLGTFFSVEGVVEFTPQPNGVYVVKGELSKAKSSVWIEDAQTGQRLSTVVTK
ncbi:MAG: hypothetical protein ACT4NV_18410 [Rhodoferax sp.]